MRVPRFPELDFEPDIESNPAIQLFGRRFYKDQTEIEYLVEFLLLFVSEKKIKNSETAWQIGFPDDHALAAWPPKAPLLYYPQVRLSLKLFTFLGASRLETRHACHKAHFNVILKQLQSKIETTPEVSKEQILSWIEQVLLGFVGVAQNRTWCTHSFLPVARGLIAGETIWKRVKGGLQQQIEWYDALNKGYFYFSSHDFMARGGELLYLQLCNVFREIACAEQNRSAGSALQRYEQTMGHAAGTAKKVRKSLEMGLQDFLVSVPVLDTLAQWIENADEKTGRILNDKWQRQPAICGWCPAETWPEAYLFAYEMNNICHALIDPLEKVEMLKLCCVLQVMRTLCAQAARYWEFLSEETRQRGGSNGFAWIVTSPATSDTALKEAARRNLVRVQEMIHSALRHSELRPPAHNNYKIADEQGQNLFLKLGKKIGFIVPWKGPGARLVLSEVLLRYFVLALIPPGKRKTLHSFQECLYSHYGLAVSGKQLNQAIKWTYPALPFMRLSTEQAWFEEVLQATGFLIPLSDAVSLVHNPFGRVQQEGDANSEQL